MANKKVYAGSADLVFDEDSGALLVKIGDAEINIDPAEKTLLLLATVTVDDTADGKTLETLLGSALPAELKLLTLVPAASGVRWAMSAAPDSSGPWLPQSGVELQTLKAAADALKFNTASGTAEMMVVCEG